MIEQGELRADAVGGDARSTPRSAGAHQPSAQARPVPRRVLVVDDNLDAADSLADLLRMFGHSVEVAYDGLSAVAKASAGAPDVVLCDLGLPGMNGFDIARQLRAGAAPGGTRLIALTGYARAEDRARARDAGFDFLVAKPPDLDELMDLVSG